MGPFGSNSAHMKTQFWCQAVLMSNSIHLFSKIFVESILKRIAESMYNVRRIFLALLGFVDCRHSLQQQLPVKCQVPSGLD